MIRCRTLASLGVAMALAACGGSRTEESSASSAALPTSTTGPRSLTAGVTDETVTTPDGRIRTYRVVVPATVNGRAPVPLLLALHGGLGSARQFEQTSGFDELATEHRFIVVYPEGIEIGGSSAFARGHVWNGGACCGPATREAVDDVGFIAEVVRRVRADQAIDPGRIYAAGHSNGAIMSYRLACELADTIVAIGVQAGSIEVPECQPTRPVSVLAIHGLADTNIPIDGGRGTGVSGGVFSSPTAAVERFVAIDRCGDPVVRVAADNPDVTITTWPRGSDDTEVQFVRVAKASHAWMGHPSPRRSAALAGQPYPDFDSSAAIWDFLAAHPRPRRG